jgi:hypothetical protein
LRQLYRLPRARAKADLHAPVRYTTHSGLVSGWFRVSLSPSSALGSMNGEVLNSKVSALLKSAAAWR